MQRLQYQNLTIDFLAQQIIVDEQEVKLDPKAFNTLKLLIDKKHRVVQNDELIKQVWDDKQVNNEVVIAAIGRIRKLFKEAGINEDVIKTVHKVGYQFVLELTSQAKKARTLQHLYKNNWFWLTLTALLVIASAIIWSQTQTIKQLKPATTTNGLQINNGNLHSQQLTPQHTNIFFLRHADKELDGTENPHLSKAGQKRASYWKNYLKQISFDEVLVTKYHRSIETANIISAQKPKLYSALSFDILEHLKPYQGKSILIIGHSNTIPDMVNRLTNSTQYSPLEHSNYDNIYQVIIDSQGYSSSYLYTLELPLSKK